MIAGERRRKTRPVSPLECRTQARQPCRYSGCPRSSIRRACRPPLRYCHPVPNCQTARSSFPSCECHRTPHSRTSHQRPPLAPSTGHSTASRDPSIASSSTAPARLIQHRDPPNTPPPAVPSAVSPSMSFWSFSLRALIWLVFVSTARRFSSECACWKADPPASADLYGPFDSAGRICSPSCTNARPGCVISFAPTAN